MNDLSLSERLLWFQEGVGERYRLRCGCPRWRRGEQTGRKSGKLYIFRLTVQTQRLDQQGEAQLNTESFLKKTHSGTLVGLITTETVTTI